MMASLYKSLAGAGLLLLSACATVAPLPPPADASPRDNRALTHWQAEGKLGLRFQDRGISLYFSWQQNDEHFTLDMAGPLGQGQTKLSGHAGQVTLESAGTGRVEAQSPEAVMLQTLGWQAPVSHLRYWLRGLPATKQAEVQHNAAGELLLIREDGWQADFQRFSDVAGYHLPNKLIITGPETRLTVLVSEWRP